LGAATVAGRLFLEDETRAEHERAVVISHGLWQRRFGARADMWVKRSHSTGRSTPSSA
jgi:hypothetical protein